MTTQRTRLTRARVFAMVICTATLAVACGPGPTGPPPPGPGPLLLGAGDVWGNDVTTGASISGNGRYVSYVAFVGVYAVFDRVAGTTVTWNIVVAQNTPVVPDDGSVAIFGRPGSFGVFTTACRVRDLSTGAEANCPAGATSCSQGSGNLLASGAGVCVRTNDPPTAEDQNGVTDAWLVPR